MRVFVIEVTNEDKGNFTVQSVACWREGVGDEEDQPIMSTMSEDNDFDSECTRAEFYGTILGMLAYAAPEDEIRIIGMELKESNTSAAYIPCQGLLFALRKFEWYSIEP